MNIVKTLSRFAAPIDDMADATSTSSEGFTGNGERW
jgi:hypothetical protein